MTTATISPASTGSFCDYRTKLVACHAPHSKSLSNQHRSRKGGWGPRKHLTSRACGVTSRLPSALLEPHGLG